MNDKNLIRKFGINAISYTENGNLIISLSSGGDWSFEYADVLQLKEILAEFNDHGENEGMEREFWRADGSGFVQLLLERPQGARWVRVSEGTRSEGHFSYSELPELLKGISFYLSGPKFSQSTIENNTKRDQSVSLTNSSNEVFVVHGHNLGILHTVARYIESLGTKAIILHEQPNLGRTIIEKFVENSRVGYAVVLLTADDRGGLVDTPFDQQKLRARQNVILELGFFIGKLGRERVCALCEENVEIPSDYSGVLYIAIDKSGAWKIQLAKELKHAGITIDMSRLLS